MELNFEQLSCVCQSITDEITNVEKTLDVLHESDTKIPNVEPMDPEKKRIKEKLTALELQQATMTERYNTFKDSIAKLKTDIYKLRQKMKYKNNNVDLPYLRKMTPVNFDELRENVLHVRVPNQLIDLPEEEVSNILKEASFPEQATVEEQIEFMQQQLAEATLEKKNLIAILDKQQLIYEAYEQLDISPDRDPVSDSKISKAEKRGILLKRAEKNDNKWQKRYFILSFSPDKNMFMLTYKLKEKGMTVSDPIALPWCITQLADDPKIKNEYCIMLIPRLIQKKKKKYYLCASSAEEMAQWLSALETASSVTIPLEDITKLGYKLLDKETARG